ncbi:hypothetical protein GCM10011499_16890 [Pelagibacterium lentulum]|uniref:Peptidase S8/S53 domain-containing protein n=1 Tax=Pelagibacterium lentulum TaxID=2029865 RepID=A0A916R9J5_9HYPH|nr:hypothetical protein GCM10011499_16890 [Pelagibacterium lentulum]
MLCLALAACGGGGSGGGGDWSPPSGSGNWHTLDYSGNFNSTLANQIRNSARYQFVDYDLGGFIGHPYTAARLHIAMSAGLTGKRPNGQGHWVHVVDEGFRKTHEVFAGTVFNTAYDPAAPAHHGTHVASLIGANAGEMMGVAPDVRLVLTSGNFNPDYLAQATLHAANLGAVAQNNSWGYNKRAALGGGELLISEVQDRMATHNVSAATALKHFYGSDTVHWNSYIAALDQFQNNGVIVWALSNDETLNDPHDADATAGFAVLFPQLSESYITVANALVNYDGNLNITAIDRLSSICGATAQHCITADGTTWAASAVGNNTYASGTGTSYAAPIVTGSVALLAEAFPNLSPRDWTRRLLASANMDIPGFSSDGTVNFGNGIVKSYDWEFGHGFLDVAAALSPIGNVSYLSNGSTIETAERHLVDNTLLRGSSAFGDGLARGLSDVDMVVYDDLNGDFALSAFDLSLGNMVTSSRSSVATSRAIPRITPVSNTNAIIDRGSWGLDQLQSSESVEMGNWSFGISAVDGHEFLQDSLGLSSENVAGSSVLSFAQDTSAVVSRYNFEGGAVETFGFIGTHSETLDGSLSGIGGVLSLDFDPVTIKFGATRLAEQGAFLGMTANGGFGAPADTAISTFSLSASTELSQAIALFGGIEYGIAAGGAGTGLLASVDEASFTGYQLGLRFADLWADKDRLTFTLSQPLRVESGAMSFMVPHRDPDGNLTYERVDTTLQTSGRQVDLGLSYEFSPFEQSVLEFGFVYSADAGHIAGNEAAAVAAAFRHSY